MAQQHQLLAVLGELENSSRLAMEEGIVTFDKKATHFQAYQKLLMMFDEARKNEEPSGSDSQAITDTVPDKLSYIISRIIPWIDAKAQFERTNQEARADVVIDGQTIMQNVPATFLLGMETFLNKFRLVILAIPTLAPGHKWVLDEMVGNYTYRQEPNILRDKTEKDVEYRVVVNPTKEHPAQIKEVQTTKTVGRFEQTNWSSMISTKDKADLLARCDTLHMAIKKARQEANNVDVVHMDVGKSMMDFLTSGIL